MIILSNNKIFGQPLLPLVQIVQKFFTGVGFDSNQPRLWQNIFQLDFTQSNVMIPKMYIVLAYFVLA